MNTDFYKRLVLIIFASCFLLIASNCLAKIKEPVVSGLFYPNNPKILSFQIDSYLERAEIPKIQGDIIALISPHAGYEYSGSIAAYGYKSLIGRTYKTIIILGPSHFAYLKGASVYEKGYFRTPLGDVEIDSELTKKIISKEKNIEFLPHAYFKEHSIEVQIPFLQRVLSDFKIVPILMMGEAEYSVCQALAEKIFEAIKDRNDILIIASTDLAHLYDYEETKRVDQNTISLIERLQPQELFEATLKDQAQLCGAGPVITAMLLAKKLGSDGVEVLKYANSGDITGRKGKGVYCVGYLSAVIYKSPPFTEEQIKKGEEMLNPEQKKRLLQIARETIEAYVREKRVPDFIETDPELLKEKGAFVTIHKFGELRGCIGNIYGNQPLYLTIRDMAIASATEDPRFLPLSKDELKDIEIEISVLSEPKRIASIDEIKLGVHGVIVRRGFNSGVFLPQVATETGWSKEEFLSHLCAGKAGLSPSAWKDKSTEIYTFTAEVFSEKEF